MLITARLLLYVDDMIRQRVEKCLCQRRLRAFDDFDSPSASARPRSALCDRCLLKIHFNAHY